MPSRVLFLGPLASYSHAAATSIFPDATDLVPLPDFSTIFQSLDQPAKPTRVAASDGGRIGRPSQTESHKHTSPSTIGPALHEYAVIPVYNSTNGPVVPVIDLLKRTGNDTILPELTRHGLPDLDAGGSTTPTTVTDGQQGEVEAQKLPSDQPAEMGTTAAHDAHDHYSNIEIAPPYTYALAVHHHLYVHPACPLDSVSSQHEPNTSTSITSLHTHPQVWTQCTCFLNTHFPDLISPSLPPPQPSKPATITTIPRISHNSTSEAAAYVLDTKPSKAGEEGWPAVLCSEMAGTRYGLKCIARNIEDDVDGNQTTFVVLRNRLQAEVESGGSIR
jgi:prephenate dehydratase